MMKTLREKYGGSEQIAENIIRKAGFDPSLYANEPGYNDNPMDALRVTTDGVTTAWQAEITAARASFLQPPPNRSSCKSLIF
ncbi:hypothetical protein SFC43_13275 [Bacteroides sp. CR5/BHMF/2]|nr:hypothetical protein [Bacteroides sp. CR5/BHMF/2]